MCILHSPLGRSYLKTFLNISKTMPFMKIGLVKDRPKIPSFARCVVL